MNSEQAWNSFMNSGKIKDYLDYCALKDEVGMDYDGQNQSNRIKTYVSVGKLQYAPPSLQGLRTD